VKQLTSKSDPERIRELSLWRARFAAAASVIVTSIVIGGAGYTIFCLGPVLGFSTGALSARAATSRKFWIGLLAVGIAMAANVILVRVFDRQSGYTPAVREWRILIPMIVVLVGGPGLVGSAVLAATSRREENRFTQDVADRS
jgi:hypothetical protein